MGDATGLCRSCGLCCDGTLFDRVKIMADEMDVVRRHGLAMLPDESHFAEPCPAFDGGGCTIYAERFRTCRSFRCKLLRKLEGDEITRDRADAVVAEAKRLRAAAQRRDPAAGVAKVRRQRLVELADWASVPDPAARGIAATDYLAFMALDRVVAAQFLSPPKSPLAPDAGSGEAGAKGPL